MGGDGVWLGTRFLATPEAGVEQWYKDALVAACTDDTVRTLSFDLARNIPFPEGIAGRVLVNRFTDEWHGRDDEIRARREELTEVFDTAFSSRTAELSPVWAGSAVGLIDSVRPAGEVVREITATAEEILRTRPQQLCSETA